MTDLDFLNRERDLNETLPSEQLVIKGLSLLQKIDEADEKIHQIEDTDSKLTEDEREKLNAEKEEINDLYYSLLYTLNKRGTNKEFEYAKNIFTHL